MLFIEAIESQRCLDEGVLRSVPEANIGSIFGIGFPAWTGGVLQFIDGFPGGRAGFRRAGQGAGQRYGDRFMPPASVIAPGRVGWPVQVELRPGVGHQRRALRRREQR